MPDYDAMADDYEANPPTADEVLSITVDPIALKRGRPRKGEGRGSRTPTRSVRLTDDTLRRLKSRAEAEHVAESEVIRRALDAYL
ncbi:CopG family transcriptional regulator [Gordonia sp. MMO-8]|uniref:ribbon-helix-helix domain-containing protein n=1 Tax=Gordonia sp. MMO-8 TaxID=3127886 RepID=UPI003016EF96